MKRMSIVAVVLVIMFALSFMVVVGQDEYSDEIMYYYPKFKIKASELATKEGGGGGNGLLETDCMLCHFHENGDTVRNLYGVQYETSMSSGNEITDYENWDVDADGYTNKEEINAGTNPGDFMSRPKKKFSKCVSFILTKEDDGDARQYIITDGKETAIDAPCYIKNNKSMVPLRAGIEGLGGTLKWIGGEKRVDIYKSGKLVGQMWIGKRYAKINGKDYDLTTAPEIVNSRTFVPVKGVGDSLGAELVWIGFGKIANFRFK
ncbi:MAG: copper amine oxidase N-terminal domain-containing protein [Caldisericia bacterium]|nr:copper amine oxidase N-terminal domain-containing protein [Caldisericia bacterium]